MNHFSRKVYSKAQAAITEKNRQIQIQLFKIIERSKSSDRDS